MTTQTQATPEPQTITVPDADHAEKNIFHVGVIVAASNTSKTSQNDIENAAATAIKRLGAKAHAPNAPQHIAIHYLTGKRSTHTDPNDPNIIERTANDFSLLHTVPHTPDRRYYKQAPPNSTGREPYITAGRIARQVDAIALITGNAPAINKAERQIITHAEKNGKPIVKFPAVITPTREDEQPEKASLPLAAAANRINIRNYRNWQQLIADPVTTNTLAGETQSPIYCAAYSRQKNVARSPLENKYRFTPGWQKKYKKFLLNAIQTNDAEIMPLLRKITPTTPLVCWCHNAKECHTDIIRSAAAYVNKIDRQDSAILIAAQDATGPTAENIGRELKTLHARELHQRSELVAFRIPNAKTVIRDKNTSQARVNAIQEIIKRLEHYTDTLASIDDANTHYRTATDAEERETRAINRLKAQKAHDENELNKRAAEKNATAKAHAKQIAQEKKDATVNGPKLCEAKTALGSRCTRSATVTLPETDRQDAQELCTQHAKQWRRILNKLDENAKIANEEKTA